MAKAPSLRKDWTRGSRRTRKAVHGECSVEPTKREGTLRVTLGDEIEGAEPYEVKASSPVVCPGKASVFSRRETYQGKSQSPVARRAGGRETNFLKPLDNTICGMMASSQAVRQAKARAAPKLSSPRGRACNRKGEGSMGRRTLADAADHSGGVGATAWAQGHAKQLEKPSSSHRETGGAREVV